MLYLYLLTESPAVLPGGAALEARHVGGLDAVVAVVDGAPEPTRDAVLEHARVVEEVARLNDAVLPARFGSLHADDATLARAVDERSAALHAALDRARGCCELGLQVVARREPADRPARTGRDYLRERREERARLVRLADAVHGPLARIARADTRRVGVTPSLVLSAAYLVPREATAGFRATLDELGSTLPELSLACTGPWPPYSFAGVETES